MLALWSRYEPAFEMTTSSSSSGISAFRYAYVRTARQNI